MSLVKNTLSVGNTRNQPNTLSNHFYIEKESDVVKLLSLFNVIVSNERLIPFNLYVIRYYSETCFACLLSNESFFKFVEAHSSIMFITLDVKKYYQQGIFNRSRATPSFSVNSIWAGHIKLIIGANFPMLQEALLSLDSTIIK